MGKSLPGNIAELAAVVDSGSNFCESYVILEGDGILAVKCYEEVLKIRAAISAKYYPNLHGGCFPGIILW